jgi:hypothetical protein
MKQNALERKRIPAKYISIILLQLQTQPRSKIKMKIAKTNQSKKAFIIPSFKANSINESKIKPVDKEKKEKPKSYKVYNKLKKNLTSAKSKDSEIKDWWQDSVSNESIVIFDSNEPWFNQIPAYIIDAVSSTENVKTAKDFSVIEKAVATAYTAEVEIFWKNKKELNGSDEKWVNDVIKSGTLSDKIAALALRVQESPFHQLDTLDALIALASKKEHRTAILALEALKDLFINDLLPNRKLLIFENNAIYYDNAKMNMKYALLIYFESKLKQKYQIIVDSIENTLKANIDHFKRFSMIMATDLIISKTELETRLLSLIVNKLGDPSGQMSSKAIELLKQLLKKRPALKIVVIKEVRQIIYKSNIKIRTIFNGIVFLSQIRLFKGIFDKFNLNL